MAEDRGDNEPLPALLQRQPPHWAAMGAVYLLMALFAFAAIGMTWLQIPEVVSGAFVVVTAAGSDPVRTPRRGVVLDLRVREGQDVAEREAIAVIGSADAGDRSADLGILEMDVRGAAESLANVRQKYDNERAADLVEEQGLRDRIDELNRRTALKSEQVTLKTQMVDARRKLHAEGLASAEDVVQQELELQQFTLDRVALDGERSGASASLARLQKQTHARAAEFAEVERRLKESLAKSTLRMNLLREEPTRANRGSVTVVAPCGGTITRLSVKARGAVVQEGDVLLEVACATSELQADLAVSQGGIALVRMGQPVKLLYDAFPYERFGVRYGTVRWISPGSQSERDRGVFRVVVDPDARGGFSIDGQSRSVMAGMTGRAQIVVGSRSLLSYALGPLRQLRENFSVPPARPDK